jgi:hypothetical protein
MKTFKSLAALEAAAKRSAKATLNNQVATLVEHKIREKAQEVVYGSYSPVMYTRRNTLGTMFALIPSGYTLRIYDISSANTPQRSGSPPGPGYFAQMINDTGAPNVFNNADYPWMHPRKFYDAAVADLNGSSELISVVRAGFLANI